MSEAEPFTVHRAHKMQEWIESHVTEWANDLIVQHFGVEVEELTKEQIQEVEDEWDRLYEYDPVLAMGFRNCINTWEYENEED